MADRQDLRQNSALGGRPKGSPVVVSGTPRLAFLRQAGTVETMKTATQYDSLLGRLEADVEARIRSLFARCPTLFGFAVQDRATLPKEVD